MDLGNLDTLDDLERGKQPEPQDHVQPHDTETRARCLLPLLTIPGITTADRLGYMTTSGSTTR